MTQSTKKALAPLFRYAEAILKQQQVISPSVTEIEIKPPAKFMGAWQTLPKKKTEGFCLYQSDKDYFIRVAHTTTGIEKNGLISFPNKKFVGGGRFKGLFFQYPLVQLMRYEKTSPKGYLTKLVDKKGHLTEIAFDAIAFQNNAFLEINGFIYPLDYSEPALEKYAEIINSLIDAGESVHVTEVLTDVWTDNIYTFTWYSSNGKGKLSYFYPPSRLTSLLPDDKVETAWGWSMQFLQEESSRTERKIERLQELIDENLEEIRRFAVSYPYKENDKFYVKFLDSNSSVLQFTKYATEIQAIPLDWHDIPVGAVGNAFRYLDVLQLSKETSCYLAMVKKNSF